MVHFKGNCRMTQLLVKIARIVFQIKVALSYSRKGFHIYDISIRYMFIQTVLAKRRPWWSSGMIPKKVT